MIQDLGTLQDRNRFGTGLPLAAPYSRESLCQGLLSILQSIHRIYLLSDLTGRCGVVNRLNLSLFPAN